MCESSSRARFITIVSHAWIDLLFTISSFQGTIQLLSVLVSSASVEFCKVFSGDRSFIDWQ